MSLTKKSFTLIEMLIVVVIIGILAAALIPRLQGVQGRARDVQRKTGLSQIGQGMGVLRQDAGTYASGISAPIPNSAALVPSYLASLPTDPKGTSWNLAWDFSTSNGNYAARTNTGNGGDILLLAARTEIKGSSNGSGVSFGSVTNMSGLQSVLNTAANNTLKDWDAWLRYYYAQ